MSFNPLIEFKPDVCDRCLKGQDLRSNNEAACNAKLTKAWSALTINEKEKYRTELAIMNQNLPKMFYWRAECGGDSLSLCKECLMEAAKQL